MRRYIDLSIPIEADVISDPEPMRPRIGYMAHAETFATMAPYFPGLMQSDLPGGESWAVETVQLSTHSGTHMDAPWHFHSTQDAALPGGPRASDTIDMVPLDWCHRPGVKLDFRELPDGHVVTGAQVEAALAHAGHTLAPLDIVLINTRAGGLYGSPDYMAAGVGLGREATLWLTERGVRVVGTDAWSWDAPFVHTAKRWEATRDPAIIWEGHKAGREIGYYQMEKLTNLEALPPTGFEVMCFPVKIARASAGWTRAVGVVGG